MLHLGRLKKAKSLNDVADLLQFSPKGLSYILYRQSDEQKYHRFSIPKRRGDPRTIDAPQGGLKLLQRRLANLLQDCLAEIVVATGRRDLAAHGFKRGRSIVTNGRRHRHRRYLFNIDLEDFFPSINFGRIRGYFIKNRDFQLHPSVATVLAQIACCGDVLPQGSPCSPVLSNLIAQILDIRLIKLASRAGVTYSRYADDLTFSTNKREFPADIAVLVDPGSPNQWAASDKLRSIIERSGFKIHPEKTRLMYRSSRQEVTGLVVNERINVRRPYRRRTRAMVHSLVRTGDFNIPTDTSDKGTAATGTRTGSWNQLHGMLGFIDALDKNSGVKSGSASEEAYRDFLTYTIFYAPARPIILCEGETDNIYLTHAIRSLAHDFPTLAAIDGQKIELKVRLYKYPRSSTARVLGLNDGGSAVLNKFIIDYKKRTDRFTAPGLQNPIIILYDNDAGAKALRSAIQSVAKVTITGSEQFIRIYKNLYAVPVRLAGQNGATTIEDCFDEPTRSTVFSGKTFSRDKKFDDTKHYGKTIFAREVVRPHAATINFDGFRETLNSLATVIDTYKALLIPNPPV